MTEIVAFSGYARSGKDEAAKILVEEFGFTRVSFADKLRDFLYALNPRVDIVFSTPQRDDPYYWRKVQDIIDQYGWDGYKESPFGTEIRELLQRLGTEAGRQVLGENVWVDAAFNVEADKIVVSDCRFPNEAQAVKDRGGVVTRITRYNVGPANQHPSETSLDDWPFDYQIQNNSTLEEYREKVRTWIGSLEANA